MALVVFILISFLPKPTEAKGYTKEIDVVHNNLKLHVEGKKVYSKEAFIYDGDLWLPLKDLAQGLGIGTDFNFDKRIFKLNSNGKLHIDDLSNANVAFQRGYEIQAKERLIRELDEEIRSFQGGGVYESSDGQLDLKNIRVNFSNIDLILDGKRKNLDIDPLIYNDDLYVSLIAISPLLYITPTLKNNIINIDSNAVLVKKDGYDSVDQLANFRDSVNNRLALQLAEMEKKRKLLMDVKIPYEEVKNLSQMESYLEKHLGKIEDLPINVNLRSGSNSWYYVDIDFPSKDNHLWLKLSRRDVEAYIWDVFVAISSLYDEDAKIQGSIRNPAYSSNSTSEYKNYVEFDTNMKDIVFSFINSRLDLKQKVDPVFIGEMLKKTLGRFANESFDYSARISGYDLDLVIKPQGNDYFQKWPSDLKLSFLRSISKEIGKSYPGLTVNGRIEYPGEDTITFLIDNGKLVSSHIVNEMVDYLNDRYGTFKFKDLSIPMKYGFTEIDPSNYKLMVYMDFDLKEVDWNEEAQQALASFLQDVIKDIVSLWEVNIFVQALDKKGSTVTEFVISQDTVQAVVADPGSGKIKEGGTVSLSTSTPGAKIHYTIDGTMPSENNSTPYNGPIVINKDTVIKTYATKEGLKDSPIYEFKYTITASDSITSGLDDLKVSERGLTPTFSKEVYDYSVSLPHSTSTIGVTPTASKGTITINGETTTSGNPSNINLSPGDNRVTIKHKEDGKDERVYTIIITVGQEGSIDSDVKLASYTLTTTLVGIFKGQLTGASDYNGYTVELVSDVGTVYKTVTVNPGGSFQTSGFPSDPVDIVFGYNFKVRDKDGNLLDSGKLSITSLGGN